ncbi:hypothetical protein ACLMJK_000802 [Lecanora helva]
MPISSSLPHHQTPPQINPPTTPTTPAPTPAAHNLACPVAFAPLAVEEGCEAAPRLGAAPSTPPPPIDPVDPIPPEDPPSPPATPELAAMLEEVELDIGALVGLWRGTRSTWRGRTWWEGHWC